MSEETRLCLNCEKGIPSGNYEMHVVHCERNLKLCLKCNEPVPHSQLENHNKEFHSIVTCTECHGRLQNGDLSTHKEENCPKRIVPCKFCDLELSADAMPEHEDYCGSRTEYCDDCGKLVMLKFQEMHLNSNHRLHRPNAESSESDDDNYIVDIEERITNNSVLTTGRNTSSRIRGNTSDRSGTNFKNYDRRDRRNRSHSPLDSLNDLNECFEDIYTDRIRNAPAVRGPEEYNRPISRTNEETFIPCEFCETPILADELTLHETGCRPDLVSFSNWKDDTTNTDQYRGGTENPPVYDIGDEEEEYNNSGTEQNHDIVLIPCEFCKKQLAVAFVDEHQMACRNHFNEHYAH